MLDVDPMHTKDMTQVAMMMSETVSLNSNTEKTWSISA